MKSVRGIVYVGKGDGKSKKWWDRFLEDVYKM